MRISIVTCAFPPEPIVSAQTSEQLAEELVRQGHDVMVIAPFPSRPMKELYTQYRRSLIQRETHQKGYRIIRCFSFFSPVSTLASRFKENMTYALSVFFLLLFLPHFDVVYGNTWPIFAQGFLALICKIRRTPLVLSIQDLYPESLNVQNRGFDKTSRLYLFMRWVDKKIARNCSALIVISEQFKNSYILDRGIAEESIVVIPNWIDDYHAETSITNDIRRNNNIPQDAFLMVYGGNIGVAAGVEGLIKTFQFLSDQECMYLLIAGAGSRLSHCEELIRKYQLDHVKILSPWHAVDTFAVLSAADLCVLPTQGEQSLVSVPSKLLTYMLAGRPVCAFTSQESETARIIAISQAGWVIASTDPEYWANAMTEISTLPKEFLAQRGRAARSFVREHFSKSRNLTKLIQILLRHGKQSEQHSPHAAS